VQAAATQVVAAVGTSAATSSVHVTNVKVDSRDMLVSIQNSGPAPMSLAGWTLLLGPDLSVVLSDITANAGQTRQVHFSEGTGTDSDVFVGFGSTAWLGKRPSPLSEVMSRRGIACAASRGLKTLCTGQRFLEGFECLRALRGGQIRLANLLPGCALSAAASRQDHVRTVAAAVLVLGMRLNRNPRTGAP
jgi:hypothetical protein